MALRLRSALAGISVSVSAGFLFCGYEMLRSPSNSVYKAAYGKEGLPRVMMMIPLAVMAAVWLYARVLSRLGPRRTLMVTSLGSGVAVALCAWGVHEKFAPAAFALYLVREAYIVLIVEQYWSFLNSTLGPGEGRKFYGPITGLASWGSIVGGLLTGYFAQRLGSANLLFLAAATTVPAALCSDLGMAWTGEPKPDASEAPARHGAAGDLGLPQFRAAPVLVFILLMVVSTQVISTMLDLRFQGLLQDLCPKDVDLQTAFSGDYYAVLGILAALFQFGLAPLALAVLPVRVIHVCLPLVAIATCTAALVAPSPWAVFGAVGLAYLLFKALDYSVFKAAKEVLYIPLPFASRYRAKEVIDVFGYRLPKGASAGVQEVMRLCGWAYERTMIPAALVAAVVWMAAAAFGLTRRTTEAGAPAPLVPAPAQDA